MNQRETPEQLAEDLADMIGVYQDKRCPFDDGCLGEHFPGCLCRVFWIPAMTRRIEQAQEPTKTLTELEAYERFKRIESGAAREAFTAVGLALLNIPLWPVRYLLSKVKALTKGRD